MDKEITIADWDKSGTHHYKEWLELYCPNGMTHACDGKPLVAGKQKKEKCRYFYCGGCTCEPIMKARERAIKNVQKARARERRKADVSRKKQLEADTV